MTFFIQIGLAIAAVAALGYFTLNRMGKALNATDPVPRVFDEVNESGGCAPPVYTSSADAAPEVPLQLSTAEVRRAG